MANNQNSDFIDLVGLLKQYLSKWYWFVISVVVCVAVAFLYTKVRQPQYEVDANLLIAQEKNSEASAINAAADMMGSAFTGMFGSSGYVEDEIFIITSHSLYRNVAKSLGLNISYSIKRDFKKVNPYPKSPICVIAPEELLDTLQTGLNFKIKINENGKADIRTKIRKNVVDNAKNVSLPYVANTPLGKFTIATTKYYAPGTKLDGTASVMPYDVVAEKMAKEVTMEIASKKSNVISMMMKTSNIDYGKDILNEIIKEYNDRGIAETKEENEITAQFIESRLLLLADELNVAEREIQQYKEDKGIIDIEFQAKYQAEKRAKIEEQLLQASTQEEITQLTLTFLQDPKNTYAMIPTTLDNEGLQGNIDTYNEAIMERMQLANSAKGDNAALQRASEVIDTMRENIIASILRALEASTVAVKDLREEMAQTQGLLESIPEQEREFRNILRQQEVKQALFIFLLQRREQTAMMMANNFPKGTIVDSAYVLSEPLGLKNIFILAFAVIFGFCIPPVLMYLRRLFNNKIETRADVENITDLPILGEVAQDNSGHAVVVASNSTSVTAEMFRLMRSNLLFVVNDASDKVILMTSSSSGDGKTFTGINLAASLALLGKKVLLVGADIRKPRLAQYLGIDSKYGLTQYLSSQDITDQQLVTPYKDVPGLDVIVAGPIPPNPSELLASVKMDELFALMRTQYDYIIVDTAPVGQVSDTLSLNRIADATIYVCRINKTTRGEVEQINEMGLQQRLKKLSVVINGIALKKTYGYSEK